MGYEHFQWISFLWSPWIVILFLWDIVWKSIAMWKSARHGQLFWFVAALIFNTVGLLPILYIAFFQNDVNEKKKKNNSSNKR